MEIRVLEYFIVVAREKNISKAANLLHISQPSLSRQIMSLEQEIGKQLLIRGNKSISLTNEGLLLYDRAREIVDLTNHTLADLKSDHDCIKGTITIASGGSDSFEIIADKIKEFNDQYPDVIFHIKNKDMIEMEQSLEQGTIDFGIFVSSFNLNKYEYRKLPVSNRWGFLMKKTHPLANCALLTLKDIKEEKIIFPERLLENTFEERTINKEDITIVATFQNVESVFPLLEKDLGIIYCIEKEIYSKLDYVFIPVGPVQKTTPMIVWKKGRVLSEAMDKFISYSLFA